MLVWLVRVSVYNIGNAKVDYELRVTVLKKKLSKLIKGRLQQQRRGANPVVAISEGADGIYFVFCVEWMNPIWCIGLWMFSSGRWKSWKWLSIVWVFMVFRQLFTFLHSSITANTLFLLVKFLVVNRADLFAIYLFVAQLLRCFDQNYLK